MSPKFSLQSVLDYRHSRVEALETELGQLLSTQQRMHLVLENLYATQASLFGEMSSQQSGEIDLDRLQRIRVHLHLLEKQIKRQQQMLAEIAQQIDAKRAEVVHAKQDEEALEILRKRERQRYDEALRQREARLQEDIYIAQAYRQEQERGDQEMHHG